LFELAQHLISDQGGSGVVKHNIGLSARANKIEKPDASRPAFRFSVNCELD
jgi:hypothetical protein